MPGKQLKSLAERAPESFVKQVDKGFGPVDYLPMHHVVQILLHHLDQPFSWQVQPPFDSGDEREPVAIAGTLLLHVDGVPVEVAGIGTGRDAKKAESDALKRAAMKVGVGLELWAQDAYWLDKQWAKDSTD